MAHPLDEIAPALAKWLAPHIAAELNLAGPQTPDELSPDYDQRTCEVYVSGIGDVVLNRALAFFEALAAHHAEVRPEVDSLALVELLNRIEPDLEVTSPRQIPSLLTNSLKRRAKALALPMPWTEQRTRDGRTSWVDRDGIAGRLCGVLYQEEDRRYPHPADDTGGPHPLHVRRALAQKEVLD